ncbi:MAG: hypothetical protein R2939_21065 [Kofleriaceae bacterium]
MTSKIITKTDRQMEDRLHAISDDPVRADALSKARAFKRTWIELAEALSRVQQSGAWTAWGFPDFEAYCRQELHLKAATVAKLLGSFRFLETAAPKVLERARTGPAASVPSMAAVDFVARATERGAADRETLETIQRVAFDEGAEAPLLARRFRDVAFPEDAGDREGHLRKQIAAAARRLSTLLAEDGSPVPRKLAIQVEATCGELLAALESN